MKQDRLTGTTIPHFTYDTPTQPQADFYALCDDDRPLILVFLPNYGHPISRVYLTQYCETLDRLRAGRLACVVRSAPQKIAKTLRDEYPFTLICDAAGALYEHFGVEQTTSRFAWSLAAARIFREAKRQGYVLEKGAAQQLPLTLVVGRGGKVLFSHYGLSLTDMPENCAAMEKVCCHVLGGPQGSAEAALRQDAAAQDAAEREDLPAALDADGLPLQAPADSSAPGDVLFPGQPLPKPPVEQETAEDHTQPIDLGAWRGETPAAEQEETDDLSTPLSPEENGAETQEKWNRLLGLFSGGSVHDEKK